MFNIFFYHIIESFKNLKRNFLITLTSIISITIMLFVSSIFLGIILNINKFINDIEKNVNISVFIDLGSDKKEILELKKNIYKLDKIDKIKYSSKNLQLKNIQKKLGSDWKLFDNDSNPLYDVFYVKTIKPCYIKNITNKIRKMPNVFKADYGGNNSDKIFLISKFIKNWGLIFALILILSMIFLISNIIKIAIFSRKNEIKIMRLVGAKNSFICWPFFLEGLWIGIFGSIIPIIAFGFIYQKIYEKFNFQLLYSNYSMLKPNLLIFFISIFIIFIGIIIGTVGSLISIRKFLKI